MCIPLLVPEIQDSAIFANISQKQPDFDILNILLLFLNKSRMFRIEWTLNHLHTTFSTPDSEFSHFLQKIAKKQPKLSHPLIFGLSDCFFRIAVRFYIEMTFHFPFHWFYLATIRSLVNLPNFAQILCWWRHIRWHIYFYTMGLTFLNSAFNLH